MSQPKWKTVQTTDYSRVQIDETGVYAPEMEIAQSLNESETRFEVFRFSLDRYKEYRHDNHLYLVPEKYNETWPYPVARYDEWFVKDLPSVAASIGSTEESLREALCSEDWEERAWAYEAIGGYHGYLNLDQYPLTLSAKKLEKRWH